MKIHWLLTPRLGNFGDVLTPVVLRAFGIEPEWASAQKDAVFGLGQIDLGPLVDALMEIKCHAQDT